MASTTKRDAGSNTNKKKEGEIPLLFYDCYNSLRERDVDVSLAEDSVYFAVDCVDGSLLNRRGCCAEGNLEV